METSFWNLFKNFSNPFKNITLPKNFITRIGSNISIPTNWINSEIHNISKLNITNWIKDEIFDITGEIHNVTKSFNITADIIIAENIARSWIQENPGYFMLIVIIIFCMPLFKASKSSGYQYHSISSSSNAGYTYNMRSRAFNPLDHAYNPTSFFAGSAMASRSAASMNARSNAFNPQHSAYNPTSASSYQYSANRC